MEWCCCLSRYLPSRKPCSLSLSLYVYLPSRQYLHDLPLRQLVKETYVYVDRGRSFQRPKLSSNQMKQQQQRHQLLTCANTVICSQRQEAAANAEQQLHSSYLLLWSCCCLSPSLMYQPSRQPQKKHECVYRDRSSRRAKLSCRSSSIAELQQKLSAVSETAAQELCRSEAAAAKIRSLQRLKLSEAAPAPALSD